jgi:hypothetical protein
MKPVDKKDMPKLIALIGLSVCCIGYGVYALVGGTSVASPPPAKEDAKQDTQTAAAGASAPTDDTLLQELKRLESVSDPVLVRDPFTITGVSTEAIPGTVTVAPPAPTPVLNAPTPAPSRQDVAITNANRRAQTLGEMLGINVRLPKSSEDDPRGGGGSPRSATAFPGQPGGITPPLQLPAPAPPELTVTGIMVPESGQGKSIAIVRVKNETRWLSVGEDVGQGFVVRSIRRTDSGSELEIVDSNDKKRLFTFKVN